MMFITIYSTYCAVNVWKLRKYLPGDPLLYSILMMVLISMYVQGLFNQVVYWPTYTWSFLHVVLASLFICIWRTIKEGDLEGALYDNETYYEVDEEIDSQEEFEDYG